MRLAMIRIARILFTRAFAGTLALACTLSAAHTQSGVIGWGVKAFDSRGASDSFVQVSAGENHTVALHADGTLVAWGNNDSRQCEVPALPSGVVYTSVSAGSNHTLALRSDGSAVAWGDPANGKCGVPVPPNGLVYVAVSAGMAHSVGLRNDGTVATWGHYQGPIPALPLGVVYVEISAG